MLTIILGIELLALSDNAILFTWTPGNDYFVFVFMWPNIRSDTTNTQTNGLTNLLKKKRSIYSVKLVIIEMREKLRSQRETAISLPKP